MTFKRLWWMARLSLIGGAPKRGAYAKKAGIFGLVGEKFQYQPRFIPIYSELIKFHNNILVARNVDFVTHDAMQGVLNRMIAKESNYEKFRDFRFLERIGCIEVMDNVFIGSNSIIMYNTRIGPNVVIASGSVVTKDCEPDSVYAGCPARKISSMDNFLKKTRDQELTGLIMTTKHNEKLTATDIEMAWSVFENRHNGPKVI